ncbi:MAG: DUF2784 domain-containing protein [Mycobacteriaceae bacterium]|nr:DUF2784 domain-containing protein [Mycobacteriaceae bacterium]MBV9640517.1 DUF2784 domain-containing protein [Mycobacteriaceae bacterium]
MKDFYIMVVAAVVVAHFAFLGYVAGGGFLALRWPRTIGLHVAAVLWGIGSVALHFPCPLTWLERWARAHAGMGKLPSGGFIDHYVTGVLYPAGAIGAVQAVAFGAVAISWIAFAGGGDGAVRRNRRSIHTRGRRRGP